MATAAQAHRQVLRKYGLSQPVLDQFVQLLDQFDEAVVLEGRAGHVGATREFAEDGQLLGSWLSASTVVGTPRPGAEPEGGTPAGGEVRPAA